MEVTRQRSLKQVRLASIPVLVAKTASLGAGCPSGEPVLRHRVSAGLAAVAAAVTTFVVSPAGASAVIAAFLAAVVVTLAAIDLERRVIPNRIVLPAAAIVLIARIAFFPSDSSTFMLAGLAAATAFLIPNLISASTLGMGDVKLAVLLGVGLGWGVVGAIIVAFVSVFPVALATLIRGGFGARGNTLPFAPFLALGALFVLIVPHVGGLIG